MSELVLYDVVPVVGAALLGTGAWRGEGDDIACGGGDGPYFGHASDADAEVFFIRENVDLCFTCGLMIVESGDGVVDIFYVDGNVFG